MGMTRIVVPDDDASTLLPPPVWALWERYLIDEMNAAAPIFQERYTRTDGTFVWRETWPGIDGSDDGYESYHNWPLFYALGGSSDLHERSRFLWDAVTRQFAGYGQVYREFDAHYDWMHHGESSIYLYYFGLADPLRQPDRARALRFARMYVGMDANVPNWDPDRKMMRSPITGSRGPRTENQWQDWQTHRSVLAHYPAPFEDIPGVDGPVADWNDDAVYREILRLLNQRMMSCDVPLNLTATSLVTHAYLSTGDDVYKRWVTEYLETWAERIKQNDGVCPDNVGPGGTVGETLGGKWWGGYYGWRWPHGFMTILQPLLIAAMNAVLLTGDSEWLDIPRGQLDRIIDLGRSENGELLVPHRHTDSGWCDYRPLDPAYAIQLWYISQAEVDRRRLDLLSTKSDAWDTIRPGRGKGDDIHAGPWYRFLQGSLPEYPVGILHEQWREVVRRQERMRSDDGDPETWDVHHWQEINPVHTEALVQLTCGGPQIIYHGGLLHVRLRFFSADDPRPGLPEGVAALVDRMDENGVRLQLVNTDTKRGHRMVVQAGAFAEHGFTRVSTAEMTTDLSSPHFQVSLRPAESVALELSMKRFASSPSYEQPV